MKLQYYLGIGIFILIVVLLILSGKQIGIIVEAPPAVEVEVPECHWSEWSEWNNDCSHGGNRYRERSLLGYCPNANFEHEGQLEECPLHAEVYEYDDYDEYEEVAPEYEVVYDMA